MVKGSHVYKRYFSAFNYAKVEITTTPTNQSINSQATYYLDNRLFNSRLYCCHGNYELMQIKKVV